MLSIIANVLYVLIAIAMIALILMQRGTGAQAGSGFGGGASSTVFGASGSANFLSRSTAVLAGLFFLLSLGMGMYLSRGVSQDPSADLGVISALETPATTPVPASTGEIPQPTGVESTTDKPAPSAAATDKPAAMPNTSDEVKSEPDQKKDN